MPITDDLAEAFSRITLDDSLTRLIDDAEPEPAPEILHGAAAIGDFLGVSGGRAQYLLETGELAPPAFKLGGRWVMRPAAFRAFCEEREARPKPPNGGDAG